MSRGVGEVNTIQLYRHTFAHRQWCIFYAWQLVQLSLGHRDLPHRFRIFSNKARKMTWLALYAIRTLLYLILCVPRRPGIGYAAAISCREQLSGNNYITEKISGLSRQCRLIFRTFAPISFILLLQ